MGEISSALEDPDVWVRRAAALSKLLIAAGPPVVTVIIAIKTAIC